MLSQRFPNEKVWLSRYVFETHLLAEAHVQDVIHSRLLLQHLDCKIHISINTLSTCFFIVPLPWVMYSLPLYGAASLLNQLTPDQNHPKSNSTRMQAWVGITPSGGMQKSKGLGFGK